MKGLTLALALALLIPFHSGAAFAEDGPGGAPAGFTKVAAPLLDAVVNISSERRLRRDAEPSPGLPPPFDQMVPPGQDGPDQPGMGRGIALGSGFIIDPAGYVVTNNHVIEDADRVTVVLHDRREFKAEIVGRDARTDLALLKVQSDKPLPAVAWGDSEKAEIGQWILAIGNPFGLGGTVTAGIISAKARDIGAGPYDSFLQTDASINRGNSGGPMFNMQGQVIGVNTAIFSPNGGSIGIGFAIPSSLARPVVDQLKDHGEVRRGWLGVAIQPVTREIAESLGLTQVQGALVADVTKDGPADRAGIKTGDIIEKFNDRTIDVNNRLPAIVAATAIGSDATVVVARQGREMTLRAKIGELKPRVAATPEPQPASQGMMGLVLAPLSDTSRAELGLDPDAQGVLVRAVDPGSAAAERGMSAGDIVERVDQKSVTTPVEFRSAADGARAAKRENVLLQVRHADARHFVVLPLSEAESRSTPGAGPGRRG